EALLESKEEAHVFRQQVEEELRERRTEAQKQEERLITKEENLDRKSVLLEKRELSLEDREDTLIEKQQQIEESERKMEEKKAKKERKVEEKIAEKKKELERISGYTSEEAKQIILNQLEGELTQESAVMIKEAENQVKEESDKKAKDILSLALQRCAADHVAETTVSVVTLPNDEMKGRIIGREGRNI